MGETAPLSDAADAVLRVERFDDRVVATLNRPEKRNAIDQTTGLPLQGLPLYHLHRRQLLLVPEAHAQGTTGTAGVTQTQTPPIVTAADLLW